MSPIITALRRLMATTQEAIDAYQEECTHERYVIATPGSDADDYDAPGKGITYWEDCHCQWCGKRWRKETGHRSYR